MTQRKAFHFISAGATVLGVALCLPAAMLAQTTAPPPDSQGVTAPQTDSQGGTQGSMAMHRHHRWTPEDQLKRMTKMLNLTPDQQQRILPILQEQHNQMESMRNSMRETHEKLEAVLTDSQKEQLKQAMHNRRDRMHHRGMGHSMGSGPAGTSPQPPSGDQAPPQ